MEKLLLVAASGLAREVLATVRLHGLFEVVGILDDDPALTGVVAGGVAVLGTTDRLPDFPDVRLLVCTGRGGDRERVVGRLDQLGAEPARYATIVHPAVDLPPGCSVGPGSIILAGAVLTADVTLGGHVVLMPHVTVTHDDVVEDFATLCAGVVLGGGVIIRRGAYIGMNACVREHTVIGAGALVGMGAVVTSDVPPRGEWTSTSTREGAR